MDRKIDNESLNINSNACLLVIESIAKFPQDDEGAPVLIANKLMNYFNPELRTPRTVSIKELAEIKPDVNWCAKKINQIHQQFGIPTKVTPVKAESFVLNFARKGLTYLRDETRKAAIKLDIHVPEELEREIITGRHQILITRKDLTSYYQSIPKIDQITTSALQTFLQENEELRNKVNEAINLKANKIKLESKTQQNLHRKN